MPLALGSFGLTVTAVGALAVRGPNNWSHSFGELWWGSLVAAVLLSAGAIAAALFGRSDLQRRLITVVLSLPALLMLTFVVALVYLASYEGLFV